MILVDTSVLTAAFRRKRRDLNPEEKAAAFEVEGLLSKGQVALIGPIRQEVLSGITNGEQFRRLRLRLSAIADLAMSQGVFEQAAEFANLCVVHGTASGAVDMMICAAAWLHDAQIFTIDEDFRRYAEHLPIRLYDPRKGSNGRHS